LGLGFQGLEFKQPRSGSSATPSCQVPSIMRSSFKMRDAFNHEGARAPSCGAKTLYANPQTPQQWFAWP